MLEYYDTVVVLSADREKDGSLGPELKSRTDLGISIYLDGSTFSLTMSGKHGKFDAHLPRSHAEDMRDYAILNDVPKDHIYIEPNSLDTVGQAIFTARDIIMPNHMENILIISSDYHMPRVIPISDFVFRYIKRAYASVPTKMIKDASIRAAQEKSLDAFFRTFEGVEPGNLDAIEERLFERHPLYNGMRR